MTKEIKQATITEVSVSDGDNVMVYGMLADGDYFGLSTLVPSCQLKTGDTVDVVIDPSKILPIPDTNEVLENIPQGIWGDKCNECRYNPYYARDQKQCSAAMKI